MLALTNATALVFFNPLWRTNPHKNIFAATASNTASRRIYLLHNRDETIIKKVALIALIKLTDAAVHFVCKGHSSFD